MTITDDEIERQLRRFRAAADAATSNLLELESLPTMPLIRATTFVGRTAGPAAEALAALSRLLVLEPCLLAYVGRLEQLRGTRPRAHRDDVEVIERLLTQPSVALPPRAIELDDRSLFTPGEVADQVTVEQLIATMNELFVAARSTLLAIDRAWAERLDQLTRMRETASGLGARARTLGEPTADFEAVSGRLDAVLHDLTGDPLGATAALDGGLAATLDALVLRVDGLEALRASLPSDLDVAAQRLAAIVRSLDAADAASEAAARTVGTDVRLVDRRALHDERLGLIPWFIRLKELAGEGRWRAARVGLDRWSEAAERVESVVEPLVVAHRSPVERLDELRGLLDSYGAAAQHELERDGELRRLYDAARRAVHDLPVDLVTATELVRRFGIAARKG